MRPPSRRSWGDCSIVSGSAPSLDAAGPGLPAVEGDEPRRLRPRPTVGDRIFTSMSTGAAFVSLVIVVTTIVALFIEARPALSSSGWWHFFTGTRWDASAGRFGVLGLLVGTALVATVALV